MKKQIALIVTTIILFCFVACQTNAPTENGTLDIGSGVMLHQSEAAFEEGTTVSAEILTQGAIFERAQSAVQAETEKFTVFEITAVKDNVSVQPKASLTVDFPIPNGYSENLTVYYVAENGNKEALATTVNMYKKVASAKLSHFSTYVLVDLEDQPVTSHTHSFGEWESNSDSHWKECSCGQKENSASHTFGDWTVTKEATEIAEGSRFRTCSVCNYEETEVIPTLSHTHSFGEWESNSDSHWKECSCGQKENSASHTFGGWTVTREATETAEGSKYRTCSVCSYINTEVIPKLAHTHSFGSWKNNSSIHWKECSCGQKENSASHTFGDWTVTKEATTSATGSKYRTCSVCKYKETEVIPVISHTHTFNRTSAGLKKGTCDVCGVAMPIYNLGEEIYDRPGENLWLVVNDNGSYDWYYEADSQVVVEDYCNAEFANNYSSYRYPVMD
ncbi:MAG: hypothetical protein IJW98_03565, partial [Clostridia bacterium]|nr:hypothetical protein [Clostridia bacterium]